MDIEMREHCQKATLLLFEDFQHRQHSAQHTRPIQEELPSPATSGYSDFGSELDIHDSGRASEVEGSPKMAHHARVGGKKRSGAPNGGAERIEVDAQMLRALVMCVRENRTRVAENELKMQKMERSMEDMHEKMVALVKVLLATRATGPCKCKCASSSTSTPQADSNDDTLRAAGAKPKPGVATDDAKSPASARRSDNNNSSSKSALLPVNQPSSDKSQPVYAVVRKSAKSACSTEEELGSLATAEEAVDAARNEENHNETETSGGFAEEGSGDSVLQNALSDHERAEERAGSDHEMSSANNGRPFTGACVVQNSYSSPRDASRNSNCSFEANSRRGSSALGHFDPYTFAQKPNAVGRRGNMEGSGKPGLVSKFKRKLKDRKRGKLSRGDSKDSIGVCSLQSGDSGDQALAAESEFGSNNNVKLAGVQLQQRKSIISYKFLPPQHHQQVQKPRQVSRPALDSIGDDDIDSQRSTDVSEAFGITPTFEVDGEPHYERISFRRPNLAQPPPLQDCQKPCRDAPSPDRVYSVVSSGSDSTLPQTVVNQLYTPALRSVDETELYSTPFKANREAQSEDSDEVFASERVILEDFERQLDERHKFEAGPPPKPSRPGFPGNNRNYPPPGGAPVYQPTGPQQGMYPPHNMPAVPPKAGPKIMTSEEIVRFEAEEKLRQMKSEEESIRQKLEKQLIDEREDALWLQQQQQMEQTNGEDDENDPGHLYQAVEPRRQRGSNSNSRDGLEAPPPPSMPPAKPPRQPAVKEPPIPPMPKLTLEEVKPTPTMKLDRSNDAVYRDTMNVVKSVLQANQEVMNAQPDDIFVLVKNIGKALKELCTSLDQEMPSLPEENHRAIDMAQKTTNKDLSQIINQMKLVKRFYSTTQVTEYKKCLMAATQVLAIDVKNLLDVVDKARLNRPPGELPPTSSQSSEDGRDAGELPDDEPVLPPPPSELLEEG